MRLDAETKERIKHIAKLLKTSESKVVKDAIVQYKVFVEVVKSQ